MMPHNPSLQIFLEPWHLSVEVTVWTHHHDYTYSEYHRATLTAVPIHTPFTKTQHTWQLRLDLTGWLWRPVHYHGPDVGDDGDPHKAGYRRGFHWLLGSLRYVATTYTTMRPIIPRPDY